MSNLASVLKKEIARLSRKEVKAATEPLRQANARLRTEITELRKQVKDLESLVSKLAQSTSKGVAVPLLSDDPLKQMRFSPKAIRSHRKRLGMSAENYAKILGVSMQTVYHWEQGKSRPRQSQMERLAAVRQMGKRDARRQLLLAESQEQSRATAGKTSGKTVAKKEAKASDKAKAKPAAKAPTKTPAKGKGDSAAESTDDGSDSTTKRVDTKRHAKVAKATRKTPTKKTSAAKK